jgi:MYXO-CTERM domain-containing protein
MADCTANCNASCQGSCSGQANLNCDIMCQAMGSANCTAMLSATCKGGCMSHSAIFCDGNFINATDANACVADLKALFNITVTGYASASSSCDGGTCTAMAKAGGSASCAMTPASEPPLSGAMLGIGVGAIVMGALRRRRTNS